MKRRFFAPAAAAVCLLTGTAAPGAAQNLSFAGQCRSHSAGECTALRFLLANSSVVPGAFASFGFAFASGGLLFQPGSFYAEDSLAPSFGPLEGGISFVSPQLIFIDFVAQTQSAFEVFGNASDLWVDVPVRGAGTTGFSFTATDLAGGVFTGVGVAQDPRVVPEPASMLLLGTGLAGLGAWRRRRAARGRA